MGTSKLTLSVDMDTIQIAKRVASESNMSVSKLFKKLVTEIDKKRNKKDPILERFENTQIPDWIKELTSVGKPIPDFDHKAEYGKHLEKKYGL
jgi:Ser-tRNA(Ala) deacylase AlaX